jgi:hypothetical protein
MRQRLTSAEHDSSEYLSHLMTEENELASEIAQANEDLVAHNQPFVPKLL